MTELAMTDRSSDFTLGIISCLPAARDARGRLMCQHAIGRLYDQLRLLAPKTRLCIPVLPQVEPFMAHELSFPADDVVDLPPLKSVTRSQSYFLPTRNIARQFARSVDVLFMRVPFPIPLALRNLGTPKLMHVVGNPYNVIAASNDYRGFMKWLALRFAAHSNATLRRMAAEPDTRVCSNGHELWDLLRCRHGRVVVSSCIYEREMQPRVDTQLGDPPRLLFVGYLRPEKGIHILLDAFEELRKRRPLKLTLAGGTDKTTNSESYARERIGNSPYRGDIVQTGMVEFGQPLFDLYRSHDMLLVPSLSEGTPRTLVEARSLGCPVIATTAGGIPSSVADGKNGLLIEPGSTPALVAAIERLLDDEPLRQALVRQGLAESREHSLEAFADVLFAEIKLLVGGSTPTARSSPVEAC